MFTLIGTDSRVEGMRQGQSSGIILRESPPSHPPPEWPMLYSCSCGDAGVASMPAEFLCGGWCECASPCLSM